MEKNLPINDICLATLYVLTMLLIPKIIWEDLEIHKSIFLFTWIVFFFFHSIKQSIKYSLFDVAIIAGIAIHFLSYLWAKHPFAIWGKSMIWIELLILYRFLKSSKVLNLVGLNRKVIVSVAALNIIIMCSVFGMMIFENNLQFRFQDYAFIKKAFGYNTNFIGSILSLQLPFLLFWIKKEQAIKTTDWIVITITTLIILMLNSKGVTLSLIALALSYLYFHAPQINYKKTLLSMGIASISVIVLIGAMKDSKNFINSYNPIKVIAQENNDERAMIWASALNTFKENPLIGIGVDNWRIEFLNDDFGLNRYSYDASRNYVHAHSFMFEYLAELGILGLAFVIIVLFYPLTKSFCSKRKFVFGILLLVTTHSFFYGFIYSSDFVFAPHKVVWIMALAMLSRDFKQNDASKALAYIILIPILFLGLYKLQIFKIGQNWKDQIVENKVANFEMAKNLEQLYNPIFLRYYKALPIYESVGIHYQRAKKNKLATTAFSRATEDAPYNIRNWYKLAKIHLRNGKYNKAKRCFQKVININPSYFNARIELMKINQKQGDWSQSNLHLKYYNKEIAPQFDKHYIDGHLYHENLAIQKHWTKMCRYQNEVNMILDLGPIR